MCSMFPKPRQSLEPSAHLFVCAPVMGVVSLRTCYSFQLATRGKYTVGIVRDVEPKSEL